MKKVFKYFLKGTLLLLGLLALTAVFMYFSTMGSYQVAATVVDDPSLPSIHINGVHLHAESFGNPNNPVVVVVHGGPGNDYRYLLHLKSLADEYYVVFYDQRGSGLSERLAAEELTLENCLSDLDAIVDHYGRGDKVYLIGHSWGGMLASGYTAKHPQKLAGVVLAEPGTLTTEMFEEYMRITNNLALDLNWDLFKLLVVSWFESLHIDGPDEQAGQDYFWTKLVWESDPETHPLRGYYCSSDQSKYSEWRFGSLANRAIRQSGMDENGKINLDLVSGLENYQDTVLFLTGSCNTIIGETYQNKQMKYFPAARQEVIQDAGHWIFLDKPEESIAVVRAYLAH